MLANRLRVFLALALLISMGSAAYAAEGQAIRGRLDNGFAYSLQPSFLKNTESPQEDLALKLYVKVAAFQENVEQQGYARLIGQFHDDLLRYSFFNDTEYLLIVENLNPQKLQQALHRIKHVATGEQISQANLPTALKRSLKQVKTDQEYSTDFLYFQPPVVDADVLKAVRLEPLQAFFNRWYQPHYMHLAVTGKFDIEQMQQQIADLFGSLKSNGLPREPRALYQKPNGIEHLITHQLRVNHLRILLPLEPHKGKGNHLTGFLLEYYISNRLRIEVDPDQRADAEVVYYQNKPYLEIASHYKSTVSQAVKNIIDQLKAARELGYRSLDNDTIEMWLRESGASPEPIYDSSLRDILANLYRGRHAADNSIYAVPNDKDIWEEDDDYSQDEVDYKLVDRHLKHILDAKISLITLQPVEISANQKQKVKKLIDNYNQGKWEPK